MTRGHEAHHISGDRVYRFVRIERLMHWVNALSFFVLAFTGVVLLLRRALDLSREVVSLFHQGHVYISVIYLFGPALVFLIGDRRAGLRWIGAAFQWTFSEVRWLMGPLGKLLFPRAPKPAVGRFNAGQRLNLAAQISGKWAMAVTGYFMLFYQGQLLFYILHVLVFLLLSLLVAGHVYMGLVNPSTRTSRFAMLSGFVDRTWLEDHHPGWLKTLPRAEPAPSKPPEPARNGEGKP